MEIKKDTINGLKHTYQVAVAPELIEMRVKTRILETGKNAKIPGFRPGKVPFQILQKRYEGTVRPEVIRLVIDATYRQILADKKLRSVGQPQITVDSYEENQELVCTYEFEVLPEINDVDIKKKVKIEKLKAAVDKKSIDETIARVVNVNKTTKALIKERAAKKGDVVFVDFEGRTKKGPISGGSGKNVQLEIGSGYFIPGFEDQIVGMKKGQDKKIDVKFPDDYSSSDLAGLDATFDCTLQDIHESITPEINDEFCEKVGFKNREDFEKAVEEQLQVENDKMSFMISKRDVLDALEDEKFDLPTTLVESELTEIMPKEAASSKKDDKDSETNKKKTKKEQEEEDNMRVIAERRVRLGLLLADIGNKNKIEVTNKELHKAMIEQASRYPGEEQKVMDYFAKNTDAQQTLRAPIFEDKVIKLIIEQATVTEKEVSQADLEKAVKKITEAEA